MTRLIAIPLFCFLMSCQALTQNTRVNVAVYHAGKDRSGIQFAFALKEAIRRSAGFELVEQPPKAPPEPYSFVTVDLVTTDDTVEGSRNSSAVAMLLTAVITSPYPHVEILDHTVLVVGSQRTQEVANSLLAQIDEDISKAKAHSQGKPPQKN